MKPFFVRLTFLSAWHCLSLLVIISNYKKLVIVRFFNNKHTNNNYAVNNPNKSHTSPKLHNRIPTINLSPKPNRNSHTKHHRTPRISQPNNTRLPNRNDNSRSYSNLHINKKTKIINNNPLFFNPSEKQ